MKDNVLRTAEDFVRATDPRLCVLYRIAKQVFLDRNAAGYPPDDRPEIKAATRPRFLEALDHAQLARDALLAGKISIYEAERDRARMYMGHAATKQREVYAQREGRRREDFANRSADGVKGRAEQRQEKSDGDELDALIAGCLKRGDPMRVPEWVTHFRLDRSTIYRRIEQARKK